MASIFLSYAREDCDAARRLAAALERIGHSVWWDRYIKGGAQFAGEIERALAKAEAVVVLWSKASISSPWVRDEAAAARDTGRLVPATVDGALPPMGFRQYQLVDLVGWKGRRSSGHFRALVEAVDSVLAGEQPCSADQPPSAAGSRPKGRRRWWWIAVSAALLILAAAATVYLFRVRPAANTTIALAVLPFDALPADVTNASFAEGVSEEISNELARNPRLKLMGRSSAAMFERSDADLRSIGRKLRVSYLLDGTVRRSGDQVRVAVQLVRMDDGSQLWRQNYSGALGDVFGIQERIGREVEGHLRVTFAGKQGLTPRGLATRGDVYAYYLTARSLIRDREPAKMDTAVELLRKSVKLDPNYAPALSALGMALHFQRGMALNSPNSHDTGTEDEALRHVRRALSLAPKLAEAHAAYAVVLSGTRTYDEDVLGRHMKLATQLDPNNAENWNQLSQHYEYKGDFPRALEAARKAVAIDPLWWMAQSRAATLAWDLGYHEESRSYAERFGIAEPQPFQAHAVRGDMAWRAGDLSGEMKASLAARAVADSGRRRFTEMGISRVLRAAGFLAEARKYWQFYEVEEEMWQMWQGKPPSPAAVLRNGWAGRIIWLPFALRTLLNNGRAAEVVQIYDDRFPSPESLADDEVEHTAFVDNAAHLVLALRQVRRNAEADRLLTRIDQSMAERLRAGRIPPYYLYLHAGVLTLRGRTNDAIAALQQAERRGFHYAQSGCTGLGPGTTPAPAAR